MFGLAAVAASVVMAFVGATSAMAVEEHPNTGFCLKNEPVLCKAENLLAPPAGGTIRSLLVALKPELKGALNENCPESTSTLSTSEVMKKVIKGSVTALTFGPSGKCSPCPSVTAQGLPYAAELSMSVELGSEWSIATKGSAKLENCLGLGLTCKFGGPVNFTVKNVEGEGVLGLAEGKELKLEEGSKALCGETGSLKADYIGKKCDLFNSAGVLVGEHNPCYLTLLGTP